MLWSKAKEPPSFDDGSELRINKRTRKMLAQTIIASFAINAIFKETNRM